ncbi:DUF2490 domain-containing protein [Pseudotamlana carrageenivorans]|nr:DUF2490 domain-containing protein [Tamlana carrageenivorans]
MAQTEFFGEFGVHKTFKIKELWVINIESNYKHAYQLTKWRRIGLSGGISRHFGKHVTLLFGISNNYRFDPKLGDFYELSPALGADFKLPITSNLAISQRSKVESKNFFISKHVHYFRARLRIELAYKFNNPNWSMNTGYEWYFLKNPINNERFPSSREFNLTIKKKIRNGHALGLTYLRNVFLPHSDNVGVNGNTISLWYEF